jgi:hypothetical protein
MMEGWAYAADNMLVHFRAVFNGNIPFSLNWEDEEIRKATKLDETSVRYLESIQGVLRRRGAYPTNVRELLADDAIQLMICVPVEVSPLEPLWYGYRGSSSPRGQLVMFLN